MTDYDACQPTYNYSARSSATPISARRTVACEFGIDPLGDPERRGHHLLILVLDHQRIEELNL